MRDQNLNKSHSQNIEKLNFFAMTSPKLKLPTSPFLFMTLNHKENTCSALHVESSLSELMT